MDINHRLEVVLVELLQLHLASFGLLPVVANDIFEGANFVLNLPDSHRVVLGEIEFLTVPLHLVVALELESSVLKAKLEIVLILLHLLLLKIDLGRLDEGVTPVGEAGELLEIHSCGVADHSFGN